MKFSRLFTIVIVYSLASSCAKKQKDSIDIGPLSAKEQLTEGKWQLVAETYQKFKDGVGDPLEDVYASYLPCEKDNYIFFNLAGDILEDEGNTKCADTALQQTIIGQWALFEDDKILRIITTNTFNGMVIKDSSEWEVKQLDEGTLKLFYTHNGGTTYRFESNKTFKHYK
ncbi:MAG: hypothetical protein IT256_00210 [Chitinophagaceae bacterium]|nr:hypothetical protein [Chitinophagaceae bacterium]